MNHPTVEARFQRIKDASKAIEEDLVFLEAKGESVGMTAMRMRRLVTNSDSIAADLEYIEAWREAVSMAYRERTGLELTPDGDPSPEDVARADEILLLFPKAGA
jgi:hypothetical protein